MQQKKKKLIIQEENLIQFKCIKEGSKLRVKIISPGYNQYANCQFPKNIRKNGAVYEAPASAVSFNRNSNIQFFYRVSKNAIKIVEIWLVIFIKLIQEIQKEKKE